MKTLTQTLNESTSGDNKLTKDIVDKLTDFKAIYLEKVKAHLKDAWNTIINTTEAQVIEEFGFMGRRGKEHTKTSDAKWRKIYNQKYYGEAKFMAEGLEAANFGFEKNIKKAVEYAAKKGIDTATATIEYQGIGRDGNAEFNINGNGKSVRCYSITAWGDIRKPHYRFIIK